MHPGCLHLGARNKWCGFFLGGGGGGGGPACACTPCPCMINDYEDGPPKSPQSVHVMMTRWSTQITTKRACHACRRLLCQWMKTRISLATQGQTMWLRSPPAKQAQLAGQKRGPNPRQGPHTLTSQRTTQTSPPCPQTMVRDGGALGSAPLLACLACLLELPGSKHLLPPSVHFKASPLPPVLAFRHCFVWFGLVYVRYYSPTLRPHTHKLCTVPTPHDATHPTTTHVQAWLRALPARLARPTRQQPTQKQTSTQTPTPRTLTPMQPTQTQMARTPARQRRQQGRLSRWPSREKLRGRWMGMMKASWSVGEGGGRAAAAVAVHCAIPSGGQPTCLGVCLPAHALPAPLSHPPTQTPMPSATPPTTATPAQ